VDVDIALMWTSDVGGSLLKIQSANTKTGYVGMRPMMATFVYSGSREASTATSNTYCTATDRQPHQILP